VAEMSNYNSTADNKDNVNKFPTETVLLLVAGGSLGAYECGVFKSLANHNIWFDTIAGTSIGAVNSTIIIDSLRKSNLQNKKKNREGNNNDDNEDRRHKMLIEAAKRLENFWLASADNIVPAFLPFKIGSYISAANTFTLGHPNALTPVWFYPGGPLLNNGFTSPYLYDTTKFKQILDKTIDFESLRDNSSNDDNMDKNNDYRDYNDGHPTFSPRLILSCTDIQKATPAYFDTNTMDISSEHVSACIAYPYYGLKWADIDGKYLWDGSLLSSSPLKSVMKLSPLREKRVISIDTFPRYQQKIPNNFAETWHRARDITFLDKSGGEVDISDDLKPIFPLLEEMHDIILEASKLVDDKKLKDRIKQLGKKYDYGNIIKKRGRIINDMIQIRRNEDEKSHHSLFEDWDFSLSTVKELIKQGEKDAESTLQRKM
jgi:NTE family protein